MHTSIPSLVLLCSSFFSLSLLQTHSNFSLSLYPSHSLSLYSNSFFQQSPFSSPPFILIPSHSHPLFLSFFSSLFSLTFVFLYFSYFLSFLFFITNLSIFSPSFFFSLFLILKHRPPPQLLLSNPIYPILITQPNFPWISNNKIPFFLCFQLLLNAKKRTIDQHEQETASYKEKTSRLPYW